jgi:hypothetical protein
MKYTIALFGEAQRGKFNCPYEVEGDLRSRHSKSPKRKKCSKNHKFKP